MCSPNLILITFFFNDTATTEIYTLSLHDALPISVLQPRIGSMNPGRSGVAAGRRNAQRQQCACEAPDRKSTRLNSSHGYISYAVFCLKKRQPPRSGRTMVFREGEDGYAVLPQAGC